MTLIAPLPREALLHHPAEDAATPSADADPARVGRTSVPFDTARAFDEHGQALLGFAVNALRDRPLAEDCVQETFAKAWRGRARFDPRRASERTWLFAIARNVIADALRARSRMPRIGDAADLEDQPAPAVDPLDRLRLVEGLARLSDAHREVIVAVHVRGLTYQELSDESGIPVATLRTRAFHGLRALRSHIDASEDDDALPV